MAEKMSCEEKKQRLQTELQAELHVYPWAYLVTNQKASRAEEGPKTLFDKISFLWINVLGHLHSSENARLMKEARASLINLAFYPPKFLGKNLHTGNSLTTTVFLPPTLLLHMQRVIAILDTCL